MFGEAIPVFLSINLLSYISYKSRLYYHLVVHRLVMLWIFKFNLALLFCLVYS